MPIGVVFSVLCKCTAGRTLADYGCSGYTPTAQAIIPNWVSVSFIPSTNIPDSTPLRLLTNGEPEANIDEGRASVILAEEDLEVEVDLGDGHEEAKVWTCDFSHVSYV